MNGTINELKQSLLKCAKDTIEELEKENEQLKQKLEKAKIWN